MTSSAFQLKWLPLPGLTPPNPTQPNAVTYVADAEQRYPCRRCLHDGAPGEEMTLLSYDPFRGDSPYRKASPIFVHKRGCELYRGAEMPEQQKRRPMTLQGYDASHMMVNSGSAEGGAEVERVCMEMLGDERVDYLHLHNAKSGCFSVGVERGERGPLD